MADIFPDPADATPAGLNAMQQGFLPGELELEVLEAREGYLRSQVTVSQKHMAPNGFMHAASVIALLDSAAGYGCRISLPQGAVGFTTIELKSNFLGTAKAGEVVTISTADVVSIRPLSVAVAGLPLLILGSVVIEPEPPAGFPSSGARRKSRSLYRSFCRFCVVCKV